MTTEATGTDRNRTLDEHRANQMAWEGQRLLMAGENGAAVATLTEALKLNPNMLNTYRNRAEAFRRLGRESEAAADIAQADALQNTARSKQDAWRQQNVGYMGRDGAAEPEKKSGSAAVGIGLLMIVGGIVATIVSYASTAPGGTYTVWWGIVVVGIITLIRGMASSD